MTPDPFDHVEMIRTAIDRENPHCWARIGPRYGFPTDRSPRERFPVFFGCYDWHSAVHSHWALVRIVNRFPADARSPAIVNFLRERMPADGFKIEAETFREFAPPEFERPYGLAWLLLLESDLFASPIAELRELGDRMQSLTEEVDDRFFDDLRHRTVPDRTGLHTQTAFAWGLAYDAAGSMGRTRYQQEICDRTHEVFLSEPPSDWQREPDVYDFLSPSLAEADLIARVLPREEFARWFDRQFCGPGDVTTAPFLRPEHPGDPTDGRLVHRDGLNLSRAWMLRRIVAHLPDDHLVREPFLTAAEELASTGFAAIDPQHFAGAHWLGSFAVYCLTDSRSSRESIE